MTQKRNTHAHTQNTTIMKEKKEENILLGAEVNNSKTKELFCYTKI